MAVLSTIQRRRAMASLAAELGRGGPLALTKDDLVAAVGAVDDWGEANATAFNLAIPQPARSALTAPQKAALLAFVATTRFGG